MCSSNARVPLLGVLPPAGGEHLKAGTCLNDHPKWVEGMAKILRDEGQGWL